MIPYKVMNGEETLEEVGLAVEKSESRRERRNRRRREKAVYRSTVRRLESPSRMLSFARHLLHYPADPSVPYYSYDEESASSNGSSLVSNSSSVSRSQVVASDGVSIAATACGVTVAIVCLIGVGWLVLWVVRPDVFTIISCWFGGVCGLVSILRIYAFTLNKFGPLCK